MQVSLDRFAQGLPDSVGQDAQPVMQCEVCGRDIYPGDGYYDTDQGLCCESEVCLAKLAGAVLKTA